MDESEGINEYHIEPKGGYANRELHGSYMPRRIDEGYNDGTESTTSVCLEARFLNDFVQRQALAFRLVPARDMCCTARRGKRKLVHCLAS